MREFFHKLKWLFERRRKEAELREEVQFHLDEEADERQSAGVPEPDARIAARRDLGNIALLHEDVRSAWGWTIIDQYSRDLRYAFRTMSVNKLFSILAIVSMALGIGANTAIFSLVNAVLLRTLPVRDPNRLVVLTLTNSGPSGVSYINQATYRQIREKNTSLEGFAAITGAGGMLSDGENSERVNSSAVSPDFYQTLGVSAFIGRLPTPDDDPHSCVISYSLWVRHFGRDPGVIGRVVMINGYQLAVLGVTPPEFLGVHQGTQTDVTYPLSRIDSRAVVQAFGRLKPGVNLAQAQEELDALYQQVLAALRVGGRPLESRVVLRPGSQGFSEVRKQYEKPLVILMLVVALVLTIACANLTNLLMARSWARSREIAVRMALGAGRGRVIRQMITETLVLTGAAGLIGVGLAYGSDRALIALAPPLVGNSEAMLDLKPDWRVLLFTLSISIVVGLVSGIRPALSSTRAGLTPNLQRPVGLQVPGRISITSVLVVAQVGLSLVLLIGAGLFVRSLQNLRKINLGFNPEQLIVMRVSAPPKGYSLDQSLALFESIVEQVRRLPGVVSVGPGFVSPLSGDFAIGGIQVPGYVPKPAERGEIAINPVGSDYFRTIGTPLLSGRLFTDADGPNRKVAIVNDKTASHYWPGESPLGKHVNINIGSLKAECEIVGVVKDEKTESLRADPKPIVYVPFRLNFAAGMALHVRILGDPKPVIAGLLGEVHRTDRNIEVRDLATMAAHVDRSIALDRLMATLMTLFGTLAVVLAVVGLYGVMAFIVVARTREIGIRMALGADRSIVLRQVIGESAILTSFGVVLGLLAALPASRLVASLLYGLSATDPWTYLGLGAMLALITILAAWIPAHRAASVDPIIALRHE